MIRFAWGRKIGKEYANEKVAAEVEVMEIIRRHTDIPVPEVRAWGLDTDDPLGLRPSIMMDFIKARESLENILQDPDVGGRCMRKDISDEEIEVIYKQMAKFTCQIFNINLEFPFISSLPPGSLHKRPLTWKAHEIFQRGGVNAFGIAHLLDSLQLSPKGSNLSTNHDPPGSRTEGFETTTEYFRYLAEQDWQQLLHQPNSAISEEDAREKYVYNKVPGAVLHRHVSKDHERGPRKLICDDLGLANMIVGNKTDLKIVAVIDLEWSYVGPAQLLGTAPWWLLLRSPNLWRIDDTDAGGAKARFFRYLEIFERVLEEEEQKAGHQDKQLSTLVKQSRINGTLWLHIILKEWCNDPKSLPFALLREETKVWDELAAVIPEVDIQAFASLKME